MIDKSKFNIKKEWKKFGFGLTFIFALLGTINLLLSGELYLYFYFISSFFLLISFLFPLLLKPVFILFTYLGFILGWIMTRVILTILFYVVITPMAIIMRLFGKKFLELKIDKNRASYWIKRDNTKTGTYENQY